ncbi:MAG: hypothetical protein PHE27_01880, partial [Alphaproteobacteria bacterium]|nr:hypothetical protein [Alphaproteobacteria bacterium]
MSFMQRNQDAAAKKQGGARKVADDSAARILELETALAALSEEKRKADELLREKTENEADLRRKVEALSMGLGVRDAQIERLKKLLGRKGSAVSG